MTSRVAGSLTFASDRLFGSVVLAATCYINKALVSQLQAETDSKEIVQSGRMVAIIGH